jgi:maltose alpha-D-glucosyltransferase/alpha-amylase
MVDLGEQPGQEGDPFEMFADRDYDPVGPALKAIDLAGYGYRWIRLRETPGR